MEAAIPGKSDSELLVDYAQRADQQAFALLVDRHVPMVYGLASREIYDFRLAEEITQNVFCSLAQAGRQQRTLGRISAWLYGATRKQIAFTMRTESRRKNREEQAALLATESNAEESASAWKDLVPHLNATLSKLSLTDQKILFLRYYEDLSLAELGESFEIKERAAQKRVQRAVERLRRLLGKRGVRLTAGMLGSGLFTAGAALPPASLGAKITASASASPVAAASLLSMPLVGTLMVVGTIAVPMVLWQTASPRAGDAASARASLVGTSSERAALRMDDIEGIYQLPVAERDLALSRLVDYLTTPREEAYLTNLFQRWVSLDHERLARALVRLHDRSIDDEDYASQLGKLLTVPMDRWMSTDPQSAKAWVRSLPRSTYAEAFAFEAVLGAMAETDRDAAWAWLISRPFNRTRAFEILAKESTLDWLGELVADSAYEDLETADAELPTMQAADRSRTKLWQQAVAQFYTEDRQTVADWVVALPPSAAAEGALTTFLSHWASDEPTHAADWALTLDGEVKRFAVGSVASAWATQDGYQSLQWSLELQDEGLRWAATESSFDVLIEEVDLGVIGDWLRPLADEPAAENLFRRMSQRLGSEEAVRWTASLSPGANRDVARDQSFYRLGRENTNKALALLDVLDASEQSDAVELISLGWLVGGGKKALDQWQASLPENSELLYASRKAEVDLTATFDPRRAGRVVEALPATPRRDPIVVLLIERTVGRSLEYAELGLKWTANIVDRDLRQATREYVEDAKQLLNDATVQRALPEIKEVPFAEQTLDQLRARLDYVSRRP